MGKTEGMLKAVLKRISPGPAEKKRTEEVLQRIMSAAGEVAKKRGLKRTLAGSYLRDTWLPDKKEFDIFIMFPESVPRERLEKEGADAGKSIVRKLGGKFEIAYAEHPYIRAVIGGYSVDIVPCYDIKNPGRIKSAVDRTPHHNRYILKMLRPNLSGDVRLLKRFCKSMGVYGSDLRVEGFSGYLLELLVIKYGSFRNVVAEAAGWNAGRMIIDIEGHHGGKQKEREAMKRFRGQPLVVIDPVDKKRNVAAALSSANFELFKETCKAFLTSWCARPTA